MYTAAAALDKIHKSRVSAVCRHFPFLCEGRINKRCCSKLCRFVVVCVVQHIEIRTPRYSGFRFAFHTYVLLEYLTSSPSLSGARERRNQSTTDGSIGRSVVHVVDMKDS